jgi:sulfite reductase (NADPH) hemoprotein beta-component
LRDGPATLSEDDVRRIDARFTVPVYDADPGVDTSAEHAAASPAFARWLRTNVHGHRVPGYAAATISLKATGTPPGDITADGMDAVAALSEQFGSGELRVSHEQNLILPDVRRSGLYALYQALDALGLATANAGLITNIVACPGGDFCALANAVSIPVAEAIQQRFENLDHVHDIGELDLNISGCINACGHHHVGHIGILGVDKGGEEWYQVTLGGRQSGALVASERFAKGGGGAAIGRIIGPSFSRGEVPGVVEKLIDTYLSLRDSEEERFIDVVDRLGIDPFKLSVYGKPEPRVRAKAEAAHV